MDNVFVYCEIEGTVVAEVSQELLTKGRKLADQLGVELHAVVAGTGIRSKVEEQILPYGVDKLFVFDGEGLFPYTSAPHTDILVNLFKEEKPQICLMGATVIGRDLGPRVSSSLTSGLTADCTQLDIQSNTDLDQIRPAFGGNVMAHIRTPYHRPQFATVRYKIFSAIEPDPSRRGELIICEIPKDLSSRCKLISVSEKPKVKNIEEAEILVAAGRGVKQKYDLDLLKQLADMLGGELACSRPLVEAGWVEPRRQIGSSGRTVKPKLLITAGISGSVQFAAGMKSAETIVSINTDPDAPINSIAHYAIIGDLYQIIPSLMKRIAERSAK